MGVFCNVLKFYEPGVTGTPSKWGSKKKMSKNVKFQFFFLSNENWSLGCGWSCAKKLWLWGHGNPPKMGSYPKTFEIKNFEIWPKMDKNSDFSYQKMIVRGRAIVPLHTITFGAWEPPPPNKWGVKEGAGRCELFFSFFFICYLIFSIINSS